MPAVLITGLAALPFTVRARSKTQQKWNTPCQPETVLRASKIGQYSNFCVQICWEIYSVGHA